MQNYEMLLKQTVCPIFKTDTSSDIIDTDILENKILLYTFVNCNMFLFDLELFVHITL